MNTQSDEDELYGQIGTWSDESEFELFDEGGERNELVETSRGTVAICGRPNVGKSTLVNRILGRREAVVEDVPGVTRDRVVYHTEWNEVPFTLVDTGGWEFKPQGMGFSIARQAEIAMADAHVIVLVVDATVGITTTDEQLATKLRRSKVPVLVVANKADSTRVEEQIGELWGLGLGEPLAVSALHGKGAADLLDRIIDLLPKKTNNQPAQQGPRRVALVGKPNVGKSSLLNKLAGFERSVVSDIAGTTVDPVDSLITLADQQWRFVDTAGLKRRFHQAKGHEYYATLRTQSAIEAAEVAVVLLDASNPLTEQDQRIISLVCEAGRALVIAYNKWDLVDEERRYALEKEIDWDLHRVAWAGRVNISAQTGRAIAKLAPAMETALASWDQRISTGILNQWLAEITAATPPPHRNGRIPRILFATQASIRPPTFVLFTTGFLEAGYRRFLERKLRESFGFYSSPVRISMKIREKRSKK